MTTLSFEDILPLLRETTPEREMRLERERAGAWHHWCQEWEHFAAVAAERDAISDRVAWTRRWSPEFNLLGVVGEAHYGMLVGLEREAAFGDGGQDFPGVDVKATSHWREPRLLRLQADPLKADHFALVAVHLEWERARYVGYATREELLAADVREYGYGPTLTIVESELHKGLPA